jgi:L-alanine-DL-glutamate epimerase-like enolase superfamily enzyme
VSEPDRIRDIFIERATIPLEPAFHANWDPTPRTTFEATLVSVRTEQGVVGYGSGDTMVGFEEFQHLFLGQPLMAIDRHVRVLETITFHAGRYWPLEAALWDAIGKSLGAPVADLFGAATDSLPLYASTGAIAEPNERAEMCQELQEEGFGAVKIRVPEHDLEGGIATIAAVRAAVGDDFEIMVDLNQSWRMPGDVRRGLDAIEVANFLDRCRDYRLFWVEEPLPLDDTAGLELLRGRGPRLAGAEMVRTWPELLRIADEGTLDVMQPDVVLAAGMLRMRALADVLRPAGKHFTPHTWSNGIGLLANAHVAAGVGAGPYLEFPYDPPTWTIERRDFMLTEPVRAQGGYLTIPRRPGLGFEPNLEVFPLTRKL